MSEGHASLLIPRAPCHGATDIISCEDVLAWLEMRWMALGLSVYAALLLSPVNWSCDILPRDIVLWGSTLWRGILSMCVRLRRARQAILENTKYR